MAKKFKYVTTAITATAALTAAASEGLFYLMSSRGGNPDLITGVKEEDKTDLDKAIEKVRDEDYRWLLDRELETYYITSKDGLRLRATLLRAKEETNRYVFCIHGYRNTGFREFDSISRFYHGLGINVFIIDQRACGESDGKFITYGYKECDDCIEWLKFMRKEFGENTEIILHGVSMGAATVMLMTGRMLPNNIVFAVEDCGYSSLKGQLYHTFSNYHLPAALAYGLFRVSSRLHCDFDPNDCNPIEGVEQSNIPILFVHGEEDDFVPFEMVYANYDACPSPVKKLITVPGAKHGQAFEADSQVRDEIKKMIETYL
ncbi:MAG: alpha/beta hydrolase [Lachnospiraceae bacterium]|nr:alpha/beta hydrolase [Lachnospiraceae bacterium]